MSYALTVGYLHLLTSSPATVPGECSCDEAHKGLRPMYVFSIMGQVQFRLALGHLAECHTQTCRRLRPRVMAGIVQKLNWLMQEESLLGCVHIQPHLYGTKRIILQRPRFPFVANHLAECPKESCAQLRRALLLSIREKVRPVPVTTAPVLQ